MKIVIGEREFDLSIERLEVDLVHAVGNAIERAPQGHPIDIKGTIHYHLSLFQKGTKKE